MTMIPSAPPAPMAPTTSGDTAPGGAAAGAEVSSVFSALVAALTGELHGLSPEGGARDAAQTALGERAEAEEEVPVDEAARATTAAIALLAAARPATELVPAPPLTGGTPAVAPAPLAETPAPGPRPVVDGAGAAPVTLLDLPGDLAQAVDGGEPAESVGEGSTETAEFVETTDTVDAIESVETVEGETPAEVVESTDTADLAEVAASAPEPGTSDGPEGVPTVRPVPGSDGAVTLDGPDAAPVHATTPTAPAAAAEATGPASAPRPAAPALPDQLVSMISPLRKGPDGTHQIAIALRPDELGEVHVDVRVKGNEISLHLRADLAGTADLLRTTLDELRAELEAAGFRAGDFDVADHPRGGTAGDRADTHSPAGTSATGRRGSEDPDPTAPAPAASSTSGLDLRL